MGCNMTAKLRESSPPSRHWKIQPSRFKSGSLLLIQTPAAKQVYLLALLSGIQTSLSFRYLRQE
ncbi:hypothetical protein ACHAXN_010204, partial [Cyclotella atomus]